MNDWTRRDFLAAGALAVAQAEAPKKAGGRVEAPRAGGQEQKKSEWDPLESTCRHASLSIL